MVVASGRLSNRVDSRGDIARIRAKSGTRITRRIRRIGGGFDGVTRGREAPTR